VAFAPSTLEIAKAAVRQCCVSILKQAGLEEKQPPPVNFRVHLAGATLPVEQLIRASIPPQRVNVDDGESTIALFRHNYAQRPPPVVDKVVGIEQLLP
jgi:hypothetical protein